MVFYQKSPLYNPQFEQGKPYKKITSNNGNSTNYGKFTRSGVARRTVCAFRERAGVPTVQRTMHPTQKPVELCEYFIKTYTRPGEVVADICAGSGTTAVAALNTGRRFICFETAPAYAAASERIRAAQAAVAAGEREFDYRTLFCDLCRSTLAVSAELRPGAAEKHYPTMGIDELCALPVADLAAPDSVLFCGPRSPSSRRPCGSLRRGAFNISPWLSSGSNKTASLRGWFYGLGFWTRGNAEICLLATRGHRNATRPTSTSLLFPLYRSTAKAGGGPCKDRGPYGRCAQGGAVWQAVPCPAGTCMGE